MIAMCTVWTIALGTSRQRLDDGRRIADLFVQAAAQRSTRSEVQRSRAPAASLGTWVLSSNAAFSCCPSFVFRHLSHFTLSALLLHRPVHSCAELTRMSQLSPPPPLCSAVVLHHARAARARPERGAVDECAVVPARALPRCAGLHRLRVGQEVPPGPRGHACVDSGPARHLAPQCRTQLLAGVPHRPRAAGCTARDFDNVLALVWAHLRSVDRTHTLLVPQADGSTRQRTASMSTAASAGQAGTVAR